MEHIVSVFNSKQEYVDAEFPEGKWYLKKGDKKIPCLAQVTAEVAKKKVALLVFGSELHSGVTAAKTGAEQGLAQEKISVTYKNGQKVLFCLERTEVAGRTFHLEIEQEW